MGLAQEGAAPGELTGVGRVEVGVGVGRFVRGVGRSVARHRRGAVRIDVDRGILDDSPAAHEGIAQGIDLVAFQPAGVEAEPAEGGTDVVRLRSGVELVDAEQVRMGAEGGDDGPHPGVARLGERGQPDGASGSGSALGGGGQCEVRSSQRDRVVDRFPGFCGDRLRH